MSSNERLNLSEQDNGHPAGWEEVAAMADKMPKANTEKDFPEEFGDWASDDSWLEVSENNNTDNKNEASYSPEIIIESLKKAKQNAGILLSQQDFEEMLAAGDFDEANSVDDALDTIAKVNAISYEDWLQQTTSLAEYEEGKPYAMILHSVRFNERYNPVDIQNFYRYTSCSLVTQDNVKLYHERFGFVYPAEGIIAADTSDMHIDNYAQDEKELLPDGGVPLIKPFEMVRRNTGQWNGVGSIEGDFNEVVVQGLPSAIFYYDDEDFESAKELQRVSGLKIVKLHDAGKNN